MRSLIFVTLCLCLVFTFVQTEAISSCRNLWHKFGGPDGICQGMDTVMDMSMKMMESFESMIREGNSTTEAISELMLQLSSKMYPE